MSKKQEDDMVGLGVAIVFSLGCALGYYANAQSWFKDSPFNYEQLADDNKELRYELKRIKDYYNYDKDCNDLDPRYGRSYVINRGFFKGSIGVANNERVQEYGSRSFVMLKIIHGHKDIVGTYVSFTCEDLELVGQGVLIH